MEQLIPQAKPSRREIGEYRRRYVTVTHPEVVACGHKFSGQVPNQSNCYFCWESYFKVAADMSQLHAELIEGGKDALRTKYGNKFVKAFARLLNEEVDTLLTERKDGIQEENRGSEGASGEAIGTDDGRGEVEASGSTIEDDGQEERNGELSDALGSEGGETNPEHQDEPSISG